VIGVTNERNKKKMEGEREGEKERGRVRKRRGRGRKCLVRQNNGFFHLKTNRRTTCHLLFKMYL
jgi:hypothetical protein